MKTTFSILLVYFSLTLFAGEPTAQHLEEINRANAQRSNGAFSNLPDQTLMDTARVREAFTPITENTGNLAFEIGGVNLSPNIRRLTHLNGIGIDKLESNMRPEQDSTSGFLDRTERLVDVLSRDNAFVRGRNITHQTIAQQLRVLKRILDDRDRDPKTDFSVPLRIIYHGVPLELSKICTKGYQTTPFHGGISNDNSMGSCDYTLKNLQNNREIRFGELLIPMIERYGFYEGNVPYRLNPADILATLTFITRDFQ